MRLTTILFLVASMHLSAAGFAQKLTIKGQNMPLKKIFAEIKRQAGYVFMVNDNLLEKAKPVTIYASDATVEEILTECMKDQPLTFQVVDKTIFIKEKWTVTLADQSSQFGADAKEIPIKGRVLDENGQPVNGVTVTLKGTKKATATNANGEFTLNAVNPDGWLVLSGANVETSTIAVEGRGDITIKLRMKVSGLDEIQIIAYGSTTKRLQTGNVTTVKGEDIDRQPVTNPLLALEGRVPGLSITQTNGLPGGAITVRIQGQNSISNGNNPLYVIDGIPYFTQIPPTLIDNVLGSAGGSSIGNPLSYLDLTDIESIDVLKDADATAIYGSRAANGAILITTKKGKIGPVKIALHAQSGAGQVTRKMDMLNTQQYLQMRHEAKLNDNKAVLSSDYDINGTWDSTRYTDWQKTLIGGTARYTNIDGNISGGTTNTQYMLQGSYNRQSSVFPGDFADAKGGAHFSFKSQSINQRFQIQFSGGYLIDHNRLPFSDLTQSAIQLEPDAPNLYNADGTLNWAQNSSGTSTWTNPLSYMKYDNTTNNLMGNAVLSYHVLPELELKTTMGYTDLQSNDFSARPLNLLPPESRATASRVADYGSRNLSTWIIEPQLNYNKYIGNGKLDILIGTTFQENDSRTNLLSASGFSSDQVMQDINSAASISSLGSFNTVYKYNAGFARINYNWKEKYIVNLTGRRDGSSRFGSKDQFHNFESLGLAWIFTQEGFMKKDKFLSFGKLRGSLGTTGSDQITDYSFMTLYNTVSVQGISYQNSSGLAPNRLPNPYLQWEETKKLQLGLDLGFFADQILINATYAKNRSSNQLLQYVLPPFVGFDNITTNFPATVQNTSWEFSIQTINIKKKKFSWKSNFNLTIPQNKLIAFPNLAQSNYKSTLILGQPLGILQVYRMLGVDPVNGKYTYLDNHGNAVTIPSSSTDRTLLLNLNPKLYGGFSNTISYSGFHLDFLLQFVKQLGKNYNTYNGLSQPGQFSSGYSNQPVSVLKRWQKPGDITAIGAFTTSSATSFATSTTLALKNASFIRLKNISLSWDLPENWMQKIHAKNASIFLQGQNLLTLTRYQGMDPENLSVTSLPPLRILTIGFQMGL